MAFVEVKARNPRSKEHTGRSGNTSQTKKIIQTALLYIQETGSQLQPRFDIAEVCFRNSDQPEIAEIHMIEHAFYGEG